jgi:hypothetical protein
MRSLMQARRLLFPGGTPGQSFLRSATQCPTASLCCADAFDDHNIKMAPITSMMFRTEGPPTGTAAIGTRRTSRHADTQASLTKIKLMQARAGY